MGNTNQPPSIPQPRVKLGSMPTSQFKCISTLANNRDRPTVILPPKDTTVYSGSIGGQHG